MFCSLIFKWIDCIFKKGGNWLRGPTYRNYKEVLFSQKIFGFFSERFLVFLVCNILEAQLTLENSFLKKTVFSFKVKHYRIHVVIDLIASTTLSLYPMLTNQRIYFHSQCTLGYYFFNSSILRISFFRKKKSTFVKAIWNILLISKEQNWSQIKYFVSLPLMLLNIPSFQNNVFCSKLLFNSS